MTRDPLREVRDATRERADVRARADERWRAAILAAAAAGVPKTEIAQAAGISRERLYQILGEQS